MNWFAVGDDRMGRTPRRSGRALVLALSFVLGLGLVGIAQTTTTTSLGSDVNPSVYGQSVAFTATVSPTPNGGTVTFKDGATVLDSVAVDTGTGKANFSTNSLSVGSHSITAEYSGTTDYNPSTSSPLDQKVDKASTTVSVGSSTNPSVTGQSVTFTATVSAASPGSGTPTGTVDFYASGNLIAADCPLSGGTATCSRSFAHIESPVAVTAYYSGDTNFNPSDNVLNPLTQTVDKASTTTSITPSGSSWVGDSYTVSGWVIVTSPGSGIPTGTVTVRDDTGETCAANLVEGAWSCFLSSSGAAGTRTLTAVYEGDANYAGSSGSTTHQVTTVATTLALTDEPDPSVVGGAVTLTATATAETGGGSPTGTVSFSIGTTPLGSAELVSSGTDESKAVLVTTQIPFGSHTITATYPGDGRFAGSTATAEHTASKRETTTLVMGSDTALVVGDTVTVTVRVVDTSPGASSMPTGNVEVSVDPTDQGTPTSWSHTLVAADAGEFTFTYTPTSGETTPHTFTATYAGDSTHSGSSGSFAQAIIKRAADIQLVLDPTTAYIGQPVTVTVRVEDDTTAGTVSVPIGTVAFSDGTTKNGVFSSDTADLSGGTCTVTYTPGAGDAGTTTITATYNGSAVHIGKSTTQLLTVLLRPTEVTVNGCTNTILVNQECSYTVTVEEADGIPGTATAPFGTLSYSSYLGSDASINATDTEAPWGAFTYTCLGLDGHAGIDTIYAHYTPNDGIHAASGGGFGQAIQRRPTITTVTGSGTPAGVTYTATVQEDSGNAGTDTILQGNIHLLQPNEYPCTGLSGATLTCTGNFNTTSPLVNVTVQFEPTDRTHLGSTGSKNITREITPAPGDETTGANCTDGCGSGGANIAQMIYDVNAAIVALEATKLGLDATLLVLDVIPDGVITGGLVVSTGVTIPYSDIAAAVVGTAGIAIDTAILEMETDLDGDGIPDLLELGIGTSTTKWDTDGDGMGDLDEIEEAGGYYGGSRRPSPTDSDSDNDGLSDGDEAGLYNTSFCVADTDCDTVSDGTEVGTWNFSDIRNHSDPLMQDTDGDGLRDDLEFTAGCPFVNDADSDDDGLQDGYEDKNQDGTITYTIGHSTTQGSGETDFCQWDTDGDGLGDGEEESLFGTLVTPKGVSTTVGAQGANLGDTVPALDTDMDNDGLPDYAETNTYQTNPMDADTDNDTLSDSVEVAIWADADARNHANPREADTDGDGLTDNLEIASGCPFVNDDDSDDDGLQDGYEDTNRNGTWSYTSIGNSTTQGLGETNFCNPDTDGDGLLDGEEKGLFGQSVVTAVTPTGTVTTVPALDDDSDNDGLSDWEEVNVTGTNPLHWDTDGDGVSDANELISTSGTWPKRAFDQESDPLDQDTDDDGLSDYIEWGNSGLGTGLGISRTTGGTHDTTCPIVNDDDSDNDGLQDGAEGWDGNATITNTIGRTGTRGSGETNFCDPDTDGDGLTDAEEFALFGGLRPDPDVGQGFVDVSVVGHPSWSLTATIPALDDDSDDDGLSDYEEVNVTGTDPLDWDTDGDGLSDADELIVTSGNFPYRTFDQESDPLDIDTDDDGLTDNIEYSGSGVVRATSGSGGTRDTICPIVNDDDSDDDGLQDGYEDKNKDGSWNNYQIGNSTIQGWGETCACNPDSDGDGLQDGEEEELLGRTTTPQGVPRWFPLGTSAAPAGYTVLPGAARGTGNDLLAPYTFAPAPGPSLPQTVPALDTDSDNDGLSDYEEVNVTGTDPLDADTDNDTLFDADELVAVSGTWPNRQFDQVSDPLNINTDDDHLFDPQEFSGSGLSTLAGALGGTRDMQCPFVNDDDSDDDGIQDGAVVVRTFVAVGVTYSWTHYEDFADVTGATDAAPGTVRTVVTPAGGEQNDDSIWNVCDPDSDGDGLLDGEEVAIGTDPGDWDTDDDGRNDWHEQTGGGPIPTDPFDPDTDDDGLLDSAEVFGSNPTNPTNCDTDADGLCDGGARTPYMTSGHPSVVVSPRCRTGIGGHPNPLGIGEDEDGDGAWDSGETDPNNPDTDGDAVGDGFERLSFSVSRQSLIPATDLFGRPITVVYPEANNVKPACGCMNPLTTDSDGDGLLDGEEDLNHDGHFDFLVSDFDYGHHGPIPGPAYGSPLETNPCDPDTDHDGLTDLEELRGQANPPSFFPFNPTNPLDHDTDNDWIYDGPEVRWVCTELLFVNLDNDGDTFIDEDPVDEVDNDGDGLIDEDDVDFYVRYVPVLDPTNRDSDSDGFIDGLDEDPCNTQLIPIARPVVQTPVDTDGDGFADDDEIAAGTHPNDPTSFPCAFGSDLDLDGVCDDRLWLTDTNHDGTADTVTIDIDTNVLVDLRVEILSRDLQRGDFDGDGQADDGRYTISYAFANRRVIQPRLTVVIFDYGCDLRVDQVEVTK